MLIVIVTRIECLQALTFALYYNTAKLGNKFYTDHPVYLYTL